MGGAEIQGIAVMAGQFGPFIAVIIIVMRSNAQKDKIIEGLTSQAMTMIHLHHKRTSEQDGES